LDSKRARADLKSILQSTDYYVEFCGDENEGWIKVNMHPVASGAYMVRYDPVTGTLTNTFDNTSVKCPPYAVNPITKLILRKVCRGVNFPERRVIFKYGRTPSDSMRQKITNNDLEKQEALSEIIDDARILGLNSSYFDLAKSFDVEEGFTKYCEFLLGREFKENE
jgi:hypothetical protein